MKFSDYLQSEAYQKTVSGKRTLKRKNLFDFIIAVVFLLLSIALIIIVEVVPESVTNEKWFIVLVTVVTLACFGVAGGLEFVLYLRSHRSHCNYLDPALGFGILLLVRELPFDMRSLIKEGELDLPVRFEVQRDIVSSVTFGEREPVVLDLAPWSGVELTSSLAVAALPILDFLMNTDVGSLVLRTVCILPSAEDTVRGMRGKPILLVKKGKWTLYGRMLKGDYRRIIKYSMKTEV